MLLRRSRHSWGLRNVTKVTCWRNLGSAYNAEKAQLLRMQENQVEQMVRTAVAQVLERQLASLRESVVAEVLREIRPTLGTNTAPAATNSIAVLQKAVSAVQAGATQKEILRALLDNTVLYSGRAALFVVKGGSASGWQGIAFSKNDSVKDFPLNISCPLVARVLESRAAETANVADFDQQFVRSFGPPADGKASLLPLLLKDKVSALLYADSGPDGGTADAAALDVLVRATSAWLEVISQRRQAHKEGGSEAPESSHSVPSNDPFAAHAPIHAHKPHGVTDSAAPAAMAAAAGWGGTATAPAPEDLELHHKAQRFARLLMDEIKLYNKEKVAEGRKHKDLYQRLKEDIEKSRATYQKRYGNTAAANADYFQQELIQSLAEGDISLLGSNFRR
jgi:hypothetical protein